jgi:uncharacterized coiled-coil DUF342 family protein
MAPTGSRPASPKTPPESLSVLHEVKQHGWRYWVGLVRRAAPWALLIFALFQVKALNEKVRDVENQEFKEVENEIRDLRLELRGFRVDVEKTHEQLSEAKDWVKTIDSSLEHARKNAPIVARGINDVHDSVDSLAKALPQAGAAASLASELGKASGTLDEIRLAMPPGNATSTLAASLAQTTKAVEDIRSGLPETGRAVELTTSIEAQKKRVAEIGGALPKAEDAMALAQSIQAEASAMKGLHKAMPAEEEIQVIRRELDEARDQAEHLAARMVKGKGEKPGPESAPSPVAQGGAISR